MEMKGFESNPMKDTGDYIELDAFKLLLSRCTNDLERVFLIILWKTGRRVSEIVGGLVTRKNYIKVDGKWKWDGTLLHPYCEGLCPKHIDYPNQQIHFWILKKVSKADPMFILKEPDPVDKELLVVLEEYIKAEKIEPNDRVIPRTRRWGNTLLKRLSEESGVRTFSGRNLHNHAFRHSWNIKASRTEGPKGDLEYQRKLMHHSSILTTMSYLKFAQGREKELVDKMGNELEGSV